MKIRANDIDRKNAERFDSFSSVVFNYKIKYCCFIKKLNNKNKTKAKNFNQVYIITWQRKISKL